MNQARLQVEFAHQADGEGTGFFQGLGGKVLDQMAGVDRQGIGRTMLFHHGVHVDAGAVQEGGMAVELAFHELLDEPAT